MTAQPDSGSNRCQAQKPIHYREMTPDDYPAMTELMCRTSAESCLEHFCFYSFIIQPSGKSMEFPALGARHHGEKHLPFIIVFWKRFIENQLRLGTSPFRG
ncbi:MAG: hypothetical protein LBI68_07360 [Azoarcus sp.]|jgi:hypothetical protein|nr:hypothetical protein [Azoarcus sp.]